MNGVEFIGTDSGLLIKYYYRDACKSLLELEEFIPSKQKKPLALTPGSDVIPFLSIHGNVSYNFLYNSLLDTPFAEKDLMQHIVQTNLHFLIKNKYPLRVTISNRRSNSEYFEDVTNVSLRFNQLYLLDNIKKNLRDSLRGFVGTEMLLQAEEQFKEKMNRATSLKAWLNSSAHIQEVVEEKEAQLLLEQQKQKNWSNYKKVNRLPDSIAFEKNPAWEMPVKQNFSWKKQSGDPFNKPGMSSPDLPPMTDSNISKKYESRKKELEKLQAELKTSSTELNRIRKSVQDSVNLVTKEINSIRSKKDLRQFLSRYGKEQKKISQKEQLLLSVREFSLGRTWLDYSELTVKSLSVNGINIELNPMPFYFAAAAGKIDYRFRDFIVKNNRQTPDQGLYLLRGGLGNKDGNNVIVTFYDGKKMMLNPGLTTSEVTERIMGMSIEARYAINENNHITAEVARSSFNNTSRQQSGSELMSKVFNLKLNRNTAYSIKMAGNYPKSNTKITASYRKMGQDFNSFNLYPSNIDQEAYAVRVNQYLWKRKLSIDAAIRKNDFTNQFVTSEYSSSAVFKSFQLSFRDKKLPFVSIGFYPTSQLFMTGNNVIVENHYNTLNVVSSYSYHLNHTAMNSSAMMTKFYNSGNDTGFIYFNAANYSFTQSVYLNRFTVQAAISVIDQQNLHMTTIEPTVGYQYKNIFSISGGFKWNRVSNGQDLFGGTAGCNLFLKKLGSLQLNYDKTYIPARGSLLRPVNIGRIGFYRDF